MNQTNRTGLLGSVSNQSAVACPTGWEDDDWDIAFKDSCSLHSLSHLILKVLEAFLSSGLLLLCLYFLLRRSCRVLFCPSNVKACLLFYVQPLAKNDFSIHGLLANTYGALHYSVFCMYNLITDARMSHGGGESNSRVFMYALILANCTFAHGMLLCQLVYTAEKLGRIAHISRSNQGTLNKKYSKPKRSVAIPSTSSVSPLKPAPQRPPSSTPSPTKRVIRFFPFFVFLQVLLSLLLILAGAFGSFCDSNECVRKTLQFIFCMASGIAANLCLIIFKYYPKIRKFLLRAVGNPDDLNIQRMDFVLKYIGSTSIAFCLFYFVGVFIEVTRWYLSHVALFGYLGYSLVLLGHVTSSHRIQRKKPNKATKSRQGSNSLSSLSLTFTDTGDVLMSRSVPLEEIKEEENDVDDKV